METFTGPSFHSSRWPDGLDLAGKRFALIGAGACGFQIGPTIAAEVEQLTIFQRTAQWMMPNPLYHAAVPPGDRWAMQHLPFYARWFRFVMTLSRHRDGHRAVPDRSRPTTTRPIVGQRGEREAAPQLLLAWITNRTSRTGPT